MSDANPFTIAARLMALIGFDCKITSAFNARKYGMKCRVDESCKMY